MTALDFERVTIQQDPQPFQHLLLEICQNLASTCTAITQGKFAGFKEATRDVQISWRQSRQQPGFALVDNLMQRYEELSQILIISRADDREAQLGQICTQPNPNTKELLQTIQACETIGSCMLQLFGQPQSLGTYSQGFDRLRQVVQQHKSQQIKNTGIYWVVDIIENEVKKQTDARRQDISGIVLRKAGTNATTMLKQDPSQTVVKQEVTQQNNPPISNTPVGNTPTGRGRGFRPKPQQQQQPQKPAPQKPQQNFQTNQSAQPTAVYHEKKSWEYKYNYEGMDQKMIEQRKRRIALKQMFERLMLGEDGPPQQQQQIPQPQPIPQMHQQPPMQQQHQQSTVQQQMQYQQPAYPQASMQINPEDHQQSNNSISHCSNTLITNDSQPQPLKKKIMRKAPPPGSLSTVTSDPVNFLKLCPESHPLHSVLKRFCQQPTNQTTIDQRLYLLFTQSQQQRCDECLVPLLQKDIDSHKQTYHFSSGNEDEEFELPTDYVSPYRFLRDPSSQEYVCLLCGIYRCQSQLEMRKHLVDKHDDQDCEKWGYSRDLIYQEYVKQSEDVVQEDQAVLGKRMQPVLIDDDDCEFRKRVCLGI